MKLTMLILMALTLLSRFIGLGREMALAYFYGATRTSDAFLISQSVPALFMSFVAAAIGAGFIPAYRQEERGGRQKLFSTQVFFLTGVLSFVVFLSANLFLPFILSWLAAGFDEETMALTVQFTRISLWGVFFMGWTRYFFAWLQVQERVILASLVGIPFNAAIIGAIILSVSHSLWVLAAGGVVAAAARCLYLFWLAQRKGHGFEFGQKTKEELRRMLFLAVPAMIGDSAQQLDIVVDKALASHFGIGSVSALAYAGRAMTAVEGIFITSVLTVFYPAVARMAALKDIDGVKRELGEAVVGVCFFLVPAVFGIMALAQPLVSLLFMRGAFGYEEARTTAALMFFYIAALLGTGLQTLFSRVFLSIGNSRVPMVVALIGVAMNIGLNLILARFIGLPGLALSNAVSAFVGLWLMVWWLKRTIGPLNLKRSIGALAKIIGASGLMALMAAAVYQILAAAPSLLALGIAVVSGGFLYLSLLLFLKVIDLKKIRQLLQQRRSI